MPNACHRTRTTKRGCHHMGARALAVVPETGSAETKITTVLSTILKLLMDTAVGAFTGFVRLLQSGVVSNWWGLACPAHCGSPSFGSLLAAFLLGFCSCFILCGLLAFWVLGLRDPLPSAPSATPRVTSRLSRYLDEPGGSRFRGH